MGGKSKSTTVGYHYRPAFHVGLVGRPIDAFLEYRAADKTAWAGELTASGRIQIDAPDLFGGEKDQGGIVGPVDVMFGEPDQMPNPYLVAEFGPQTAAWRGMTTLAFCGGRFGAMNPYQQKSAYKIRKILNGWDGGAWNPERAAIVIGRFLAAGRNWRWLAVPNSDSVNRAAINFDDSGWAMGRPPFGDKPWPGVGPGQPGGNGFASVPATIVPQAMKVWMRARLSFPDLPETIRFQAFVDNDCRLYVNGQLVVSVGGPFGAYYDVPISTAAFVPGENVIAVEGWDRHSGSGNWFWFDWRLETERDVLGMNPAHILYYIRTDSEKGGEPRAVINEMSLTAASERLAAEGFGLNVVYDPAQVSPDSMTQRICQIIGGSFERSLVDGQWYLDLARDDFDIHALPIVGEDDILELRRQPTTLHGVTNSLAVRYFDPLRKESVVTPSVRALGLIRAFGEIHETLDFPEIGDAATAAKVADRELRARISPTEGLELVTRPRRELLELRPSQFFRLQSPKRGIIDMVCIVGERDAGSLRSGAMRWKVAQHIYSLAFSSYIEVEDGVDTRPPQRPFPIEHARAFEAPYVEVVRSLPRAELEALPDNVGFLLGVAARPLYGLDFALASKPAGGEYEVVANGEWCPTATVAAAIPLGVEPVVVPLSSVRGLDRVTVGSAVLMGRELLRLDAKQLEPPEVTLARGCADTVPEEHPLGERMWFIGEDVASDATEYAEGETVGVKFLTNSGSQQLPVDLAPETSIVLAGRQSRPYAPAGLAVNGIDYPDPDSPFTGSIELSWRRRNRVVQADQLIDQSMGDIDPEDDARVCIEYYQEDGVEPIAIEKGVEGTTSTPWTPPAEGRYRIEAFSVLNGVESFQRQVRVVQIGAELWTPLHLDNPPQVWLDRRSSVEISAGRLGLWSDQSENGWHAIQNSPSRRPEVMTAPWRVKYQPGVYLDLPAGSNGLYRNVTSAWVLSVFKRSLDAGDVERPVVYFTTPTFSTRVAMTAGGAQAGASNLVQYGGRRIDSEGFDFVGASHGGDWVISLGRTDYTARRLELWMDGSLVASKVNAFGASGATSNTASNWIRLGANAGDPPAQHFEGEQRLIMAGVSLPSPAEVDRIFGWVAHESDLDLSGALPADHPFRHVPPYRDTPILQTVFTSEPFIFGFVAAGNGLVAGLANGPALPVEFGTLLNSEPTLASGQGITVDSIGGVLRIRLDGITMSGTPNRGVVMDHKGAELATVALVYEGGSFEGSAPGELDPGGVYYVRIETG